MRKHICSTVIALMGLLMLAACNMPSLQQSSIPITPIVHCGDGICEDPEAITDCPADCQLSNPTVEAADEMGGYWVTNPASGAELYVRTLRPQIWGGEPLPTLVLVPGGNDDSSGFLEPPQNQAQRMADAGFVIVMFDPDGRGQSKGEEDYGGFIHQDGLAAIIRQVATLPEVDPSAIGLVSYSYGITMATGALARYPDLPVSFLIDWEGPADRNDTGGCDSNHVGHLVGIAECSDEAFWSQREALTFIAQIKVPYQRIQSEQDHAQPDNTHAIALINAAVNGNASWVRLNDLEPNQAYDPTSPLAMLPEEIDNQQDELVIRCALEMLTRPK